MSFNQQLREPRVLGTLTPRLIVLMAFIAAALVAGLSAYQRQQMVRMHSASFRQVFERMRTWIQGNF
jgi:hypothetical protein